MKAKKRARNRIESENNYKIVIALNNVDRYVSYRLAIASVVFKVKKKTRSLLAFIFLLPSN